VIVCCSKPTNTHCQSNQNICCFQRPLSERHTSLPKLELDRHNRDSMLQQAHQYTLSVESKHMLFPKTTVSQALEAPGGPGGPEGPVGPKQHKTTFRTRDESNLLLLLFLCCNLLLLVDLLFHKHSQIKKNRTCAYRMGPDPDKSMFAFSRSFLRQGRSWEIRKPRRRVWSSLKTLRTVSACLVIV